MSVDTASLATLDVAIVGIGVLLALVDIARRHRDITRPLQPRIGPQHLWWPGQLRHVGGLNYVTRNTSVHPRKRKLFGRAIVVVVVVVSGVSVWNAPQPADMNSLVPAASLFAGYLAMWILRWSIRTLTWLFRARVR